MSINFFFITFTYKLSSLKKRSYFIMIIVKYFSRRHRSRYLFVLSPEVFSISLFCRNVKLWTHGYTKIVRQVEVVGYKHRKKDTHKYIIMFIYIFMSGYFQFSSINCTRKSFGSLML